ncbi:hypothetical protein IQ266_12705 [filamentous cyanobacterium LEGE 11480]|uniref:NADPH-dependent FMN reductase-like domain-containing protein n=1 Tax=Romeriopsis navalis LEGE 11480 TaxID=2777977 RepID=A0A928VL62_9CYAN|nr:NAD(P)H-dependent oxidoreductase [Romeriopsis navalis]MBE9030591.1 hypothetical protein [Romeriopsis navalis LEGE 11480]
MTKVFAICGSLSAQSSNQAVLQAAAVLAPVGMQIDLYGGVGELSHFNPDRDVEPAPAAIAHFRQQFYRRPQG